MGIEIKAAENRRVRRDFLMLPWRIYAGDQYWVPPLLTEMKRIINPRRNGHLRKGPSRLFVAYRDGGPVGRMMVGVDEEVNRAKGLSDCWFSLFETINDLEVVSALCEEAISFARARGMRRLHGPMSPTGGDDYRGLLVEGFSSPPVLMDSYNPPYYPELLEAYGLQKEHDLYAYHFDCREPKNPDAVAYAQKRFGFRLDRLDLRHLDREVRDIKSIIDRAMPETWPDMVPPTLAEVREMADALKTHADPDLVFIARVGDEPIGFNVTLPDLNQALHRLNGRLFPLGWLKFLYWRRRIDALRFFVLFVVPAWRQKGVSAAIFLETFRVAAAKGITWGEGSTIGEENLPMRRDVERAGGAHYKTYRLMAREV